MPPTKNGETAWTSEVYAVCTRTFSERYHEAYPIPNTIGLQRYQYPITDTDTEYDVISTTHQCHKFISTGQCYSYSHYQRRSDGRTVCDMRRARWGKVVNGGRWTFECGGAHKETTERIQKWRYNHL